MKVRVVALASVLLSVTNQYAQATDVSAGVRDRKQHQDWVSFEVRGPGYGMFIMGRATTGNRKKAKTETNLILESRVNYKSYLCEESAELIIERSGAGKAIPGRKSNIRMSLDGGPFRSVPVIVEAAKGDNWVYIDMPKDFLLTLLTGRKTLSMQSDDHGAAEFSLSGMQQAWREAKESSASFCCPPGARCE